MKSNLPQGDMLLLLSPRKRLEAPGALSALEVLHHCLDARLLPMWRRPERRRAALLGEVDLGTVTGLSKACSLQNRIEGA